MFVLCSKIVRRKDPLFEQNTNNVRTTLEQSTCKTKIATVGILVKIGQMFTKEVIGNHLVQNVIKMGR
ncbi:MAG: hypothetical protein COA40_06775 [Aequorivita sp.]|nr:MAG: hypothetical protein COA40_06775 [Aequorivita sp.]